eukprot:4161553-Alexandrium_andersonii.AAC.1
MGKRLLWLGKSRVEVSRVVRRPPASLQAAEAQARPASGASSAASRSCGGRTPRPAALTCVAVRRGFTV